MFPKSLQLYPRNLTKERLDICWSEDYRPDQHLSEGENVPSPFALTNSEDPVHPL